MELENIDKVDMLGTNYTCHKVFDQLEYYCDFYNSLSFLVSHWVTRGTTALINLDTYIYSSIKGTLDSIKHISSKGRINDAYALLRKYYDSTIINIYTNLYINDHFNQGNYIVAQIEDWKKGNKKIPEFGSMIKYIVNSQRLKPITNLLVQGNKYQDIRNRCNDHTHYNFYNNLLLNDNQIYNPNRIKYLDTLHEDIEALFIQHFSYIFFINDHYMMSTDYMDCLDCGSTPEENSQYWVANFIQKAFDEVIKKKRPDLADVIRKNTQMQLG